MEVKFICCRQNSPVRAETGFQGEVFRELSGRVSGQHCPRLLLFLGQA